MIGFCQTDFAVRSFGRLTSPNGTDPRFKLPAELGGENAVVGNGGGKTGGITVDCSAAGGRSTGGKALLPEDRCNGSGEAEADRPRMALMWSAACRRCTSSGVDNASSQWMLPRKNRNAPVGS